MIWELYFRIIHIEVFLLNLQNDMSFQKTFHIRKEKKVLKVNINKYLYCIININK